MSPLRRAAAALLLLLPCLPACEGPRMIAGRVRDGAGNPVPHAFLRTRDDVGDVANAETDDAGWFSFSVFVSVIQTRATVRVDANGYHTRYVRLPFREGVEVVLVPDSVKRRGPDWSDPETGPAVGLHYGVPLRWSYTVGLTRGRFAGFYDYAGWTVAVEPGEGGVKGRVGYLRYGRRVGGQLSAAMLRTGAHALTIAPHQGYAGAEARIFLIPLTFTFGGYGRISGSAPGDERLFAAGIGVGF
ncbi:MAG: carboxypeptidase-like regulatory domain-containing protein [Longimicrobiaceae bacterium]